MWRRRCGRQWKLREGTGLRRGRGERPVLSFSLGPCCSLLIWRSRCVCLLHTRCAVFVGFILNLYMCACVFVSCLSSFMRCCTYSRLYTHPNFYIFMCIYVCMHVHACISICTYMRKYTRMRRYIYAYVYVHACRCVMCCATSAFCSCIRRRMGGTSATRSGPSCES